LTWLEWWLGESTEDGMRRIPYPGDWGKVYAIVSDARDAIERDTIDWYYHAGYGERRARDPS
jgi:hypothetical protein